VTSYRVEIKKSAAKGPSDDLLAVVIKVGDRKEIYRR
jgi:hypothetical protein